MQVPEASLPQAEAAQRELATAGYECVALAVAAAAASSVAGCSALRKVPSTGRVQAS